VEAAQLKARVLALTEALDASQVLHTAAKVEQS
jgi:hypothetical protein